MEGSAEVCQCTFQVLNSSVLYISWSDTRVRQLPRTSLLLPLLVCFIRTKIFVERERKNTTVHILDDLRIKRKYWFCIATKRVDSKATAERTPLHVMDGHEGYLNTISKTISIKFQQLCEKDNFWYTKFEYK